MPSGAAPGWRWAVPRYLEAIGRLIRPQHQAARVLERVDVAVLHDEVAEVQRLCGVGSGAAWRLGSPSCPPRWRLPVPGHSPSSEMPYFWMSHSTMSFPGDRGCVSGVPWGSRDWARGGSRRGHLAQRGSARVAQGDGGPAKDVRAPAPRSRCIIDPSCGAGHPGCGDRSGAGPAAGAAAGLGTPGDPQHPPPPHLAGAPWRGPTCHGVGDDGDEQALVPHLDAHVGVLHADDHPLHLPGEEPLCSAPRLSPASLSDPGNPVTLTQPGASQ